MPRTEDCIPTVTLTKAEARRFLLAHQRLWPPRQLRGKSGIMDYVAHAGCIQFEPINVVGRNPDLVLQSRVAGYRPEMLEELLYTDRTLLDGWDKVSSIYAATDWPYFARHRAAMRERHGSPSGQPLVIPPAVVDEIREQGGPHNPVMAAAPLVLDTIRERGPLSSIDLKLEGKIDWSWGQETRLVRATLEVLYATGRLGVHHRVGTRRAFDLIERLLPAGVLAAPDPNETEEDYQDWHVLRRVGSLGLANPSATDYWLGISGVKTRERRAALARLTECGKVVPAAIEGVPSRTLFIRASDLPVLHAVRGAVESEPRAAIIGALDNLMWDRDLVRWVFDFDYVWEVYKPPSKRKYGFYVLPVLCGDRFVARFEPKFESKTRVLTINNWWWEEGIEPDGVMDAALVECFDGFARYLSGSEVHVGEAVAGNQTLHWAGGLGEHGAGRNARASSDRMKPDLRLAPTD
jgi:uncharacterized protein YcaQ